jgi:hypothetical protein
LKNLKLIENNFLAIQQEKTQNDLMNGIEGFNRTSLKHAETNEKNPLPTKETIDQEKAA